MNRNSAITNSAIAHRLGLWLESAECAPALMAARIAALLMPPMPDMNTSFRSEPRIPRRTSCKKDIGVTSSVYGSTRRRRRLSAATYAEAEARTDPAPRRPFDAAGWPCAAVHRPHQQDSARKRGDKRGKTKKAAGARSSG